MPVCIAGMHRSGTSMVARLLHICGLFLSSTDHLIAAAPDNPEGFWESTDVVNFNDDILTCLQAGWDFPPPYAPAWALDPAFIPLRARAAEFMQGVSAEDIAHQQHAAVLHNQLTTHRHTITALTV